ncbi:Hypothetical protein SMAX5B_001429 [Scophthalmus maximus]|uniref:Uncharacterized protein n=1 Tax=Scophthalmus maximus TaxID=52904 RepID=A0A2U9B119_SCOMX|nr:Hypothetical protein SMAX5B_001429 [Scophthalmus maximus]
MVLNSWAAVRTRVEGAELATKQIDRGSRRAESFRRQPDRERAEAAITHVCPDQDSSIRSVKDTS